MEREGTPCSDTVRVPPRMPGIPASSAGIRYKSETHSPERGGTRFQTAPPVRRQGQGNPDAPLRSELLSHLRSGTAAHPAGHAAHLGVFPPLRPSVSSSWPRPPGLPPDHLWASPSLLHPCRSAGLGRCDIRVLSRLRRQVLRPCCPLLRAFPGLLVALRIQTLLAVV